MVNFNAESVACSITGGIMICSNDRFISFFTGWFATENTEKMSENLRVLRTA